MKNFKKVFSFLLSLAFVFSFLGTTASVNGISIENVFADKNGSYSGTCGENLSWTLDSEGTLTVLGTGEMKDYLQKSAPWYSLRSRIYKVIIGDEVTSIGDSAFYGCNNLASVEVGASVKTIGNKAFFYCDYLENVTLPDSLISIGDKAFEECDYLETIVIPDSVVSIGEDSFSDCDYLWDVTLGKSLETIGYGAFRWCGYLETITIPASVTYIGECAFYECEYLYEINVAEENKHYSSENGVLFNKNKTSLICYPQYKWDESYIIPDSVVSIENYAFYYCTSLMEVSIGDFVTHIGTDAFYSTGYYDNSSNWTAGVLYLDDYLICAQNGRVFRDYIVKDGTKVIADNAFWLCEYLITVDVPSSVTNIGENAFYNCVALVEVNVAEDNSNYFSENGILFNKDKTELICFPANKQITDYTVPENVKTIGDYAFGYCTTLAQITIGESVTSVGDFAFSYCEKLQSIIIPESVEYLGIEAFSNCEALTQAVIYGNIDAVMENTFYYCAALVSVTMPNTVTSIGDNAFYCCSSLVSLDIPSGVTAIGKEAFFYCVSLASVSIPSSVIFVGESAFYWCENLSGVTIPSSVTTIELQAFGYYHDWGVNDVVLVPDFTVTGVKGTAAEKYAVENGITFIAVSYSLPTAESKVYMDNSTNTMPNVVEKTTADSIISSLAAYNVSAVITDKDGNSLGNTDTVGTGCKVRTSDGNEYTVIVCGDVDGTGIIDATDYLKIKTMFIDGTTLGGVYSLAADTDESGKVDSTDYLRIKSYFLGDFDLYK